MFVATFPLILRRRSHQKHFSSSGQEGARQTARMLGTVVLETCASASNFRRETVGMESHDQILQRVVEHSVVCLIECDRVGDLGRASAVSAW